MRRCVITGTSSTRTRSASFKISFLLLPSCRLVRSLRRQYKSNFSHTLFIFLKSGRNLHKQLKSNSFSLFFNIPEGWTVSFSSPAQSILPLLLQQSRLDVGYTRVTEKNLVNCFDNKIPEGWKFY